jgi:hypothetical protein
LLAKQAGNTDNEPLPQQAAIDNFFGTMSVLSQPCDDDACPGFTLLFLRRTTMFLEE